MPIQYFSLYLLATTENFVIRQHFPEPGTRVPVKGPVLITIGFSGDRGSTFDFKSLESIM